MSVCCVWDDEGRGRGARDDEGGVWGEEWKAGMTKGKVGMGKGRGMLLDKVDKMGLGC